MVYRILMFSFLVLLNVADLGFTQRAIRLGIPEYNPLMYRALEFGGIGIVAAIKAAWLVPIFFGLVRIRGQASAFVDWALFFAVSVYLWLFYTHLSYLS